VKTLLNFADTYTSFSIKPSSQLTLPKQSITLLSSAYTRYYSIDVVRSGYEEDVLRMAVS
jgi:hypothetical protein